MDTARIYIQAPTLTPLRGGLRTSATVVDATDPRAAFGIEYQPEACGQASIDVNRCVDTTTEKDFENGIGTVTGTPFTVYKGVECDLFSYEEVKRRASKGLELGAWRAVEEWTWENLLAVNTTTDLTPAPVPNLKVGIGLLEAYAAANYGGIATLHMPRSAVSLMYEVHGDPDHLHTLQGTKIANGAGYAANTSPAGVPAGAGEAWLYISGEVLVTRSPVVTADAPMLVNNRSVALAEQVHTVTIECFVAAVRVDLEI